MLDLSLAYAKEREAFGKPIGAFQHNRFLLAEMATEARIARVFVDDCLARHLRGELDAATASMAKWWTTELQKRLVDRASSCTAATATCGSTRSPGPTSTPGSQTIYGGTTEIQKEIIGRSLGV